MSVEGEPLVSEVIDKEYLDNNYNSIDTFFFILSWKFFGFSLPILCKFYGKFIETFCPNNRIDGFHRTDERASADKKNKGDT
jgi:hypothetical protein